jgi:uncharacterized protein YfiM (DUF2279 family)
MSQGQFDTTRRKQIVLGGNALAYTGTMTGLYLLWYKNYPSSSFHFHNDNSDWYQMDKVGHVYSCYYEGVVGIDMMKWAGYSKKQQVFIGGAYGFFIQSGVEILDGFSDGWGASTGDIAANVIGTGMVMAQAWYWDEQRIWLKLSHYPSPYASYRPQLLGSSYVEQLFKDYNGQTYWLSVNVASFLKPESKWPKWLNVATGYGIEGFIGSKGNYYTNEDDVRVVFNQFQPARQFYLAPDIDLTRIPTNKKGIKIALRMLNTLKFPLPGMSYSTKTGLDWDWIAY